MCKSWCELIIALVVIIFALWDTMAWSKWIVVIAGIVLLIHSFSCKKCFAGGKMNHEVRSSAKRKR